MHQQLISIDNDKRTELKNQAQLTCMNHIKPMTHNKIAINESISFHSWYYVLGGKQIHPFFLRSRRATPRNIYTYFF